MAYDNDDFAAELAIKKNTEKALKALRGFKNALPPDVFAQGVEALDDALHGGERLSWKGKRQVQEAVARVFHTFAMAAGEDMPATAEDAPF
jgi:hypothetical protein